MSRKTALKFATQAADIPGDASDRDREWDGAGLFVTSRIKSVPFSIESGREEDRRLNMRPASRHDAARLPLIKHGDRPGKNY
jgi:hypothetical protein